MVHDLKAITRIPLPTLSVVAKLQPPSRFRAPFLAFSITRSLCEISPQVELKDQITIYFFIASEAFFDLRLFSYFFHFWFVAFVWVILSVISAMCLAVLESLPFYHFFVDSWRYLISFWSHLFCFWYMFEFF